MGASLHLAGPCAGREWSRQHPSRHQGAVVPIPPMQKSILFFNKSIFAAANDDFFFLGKAIFLLKCQPDLEITEQAPLVRTLKRLKEVYKLFGKHVAASVGKKTHHFGGETWTPGLRSLPALFLEASREDASQARQENKGLGRRTEKLI